MLFSAPFFNQSYVVFNPDHDTVQFMGLYPCSLSFLNEMIVNSLLFPACTSFFVLLLFPFLLIFPSVLTPVPPLCPCFLHSSIFPFYLSYSNIFISAEHWHRMFQPKPSSYCLCARGSFLFLTFLSVLFFSLFNPFVPLLLSPLLREEGQCVEGIMEIFDMLLAATSRFRELKLQREEYVCLKAMILLNSSESAVPLRFPLGMDEFVLQQICIQSLQLNVCLSSLCNPDKFALLSLVKQ